MSIATDGLLLFGINVGEDLQEVVKALDIFEEGTAYDELDSDECQEALEDWLPKSVELVMTGHPEGCPEFFIAAKGYKTAKRGYPVELKQRGILKVSPTARRALAKLERALDIRPAYWLASYTDF